jgi:formylglycine-generating enzyme required for sulfatase activity
MTRRAQTGRAELLRALAQGVEAPLALDSTETVWFGFLQESGNPRAQHLLVGAAQVSVQMGTAQVSEASDDELQRPPLQMDTIWAVVERTEIPSDEASTDLTPQVEPITEDEAKARYTERQFEFEDLVPWARLTPVLRQRLAKSHRAGVDMAAVCRAVARQQPLRHRLPQQTRTRWHPDLVVVLDFSPRLWPYRWDMHRLCAQLRRQCGRHGVSLRVLSNGPWGQWTGWRGDAGPDDAAEFEARDWVMPAAGSRLLIVGDLGRLSPGGAMEPAWRGFVEDVLAAGVQVEALVPLGAGQVSAEWAARLPVIRWSQDSALRPERGETPTDDAHDPDFQALMAMVAGLRRVDPPLLRALRRVLPDQHGNAGFEGLVWSHADVRPGMACEVAPEAAAGWLDHYRERLAPELQRAHQTLRRKHHGHLRAALNHEEVLLHAAHADADVGAVSAEEVEASEQFLARVARWAGDMGGHAAPAAWQTFASEAVRRADPRTAQRFAGVYTDLLAADLRRRGVLRPEGEDLPAWVETARLLGRLAQQQGKARRYWLVEDMRRRCIQLQPEPPGRLQRMLMAPIDAARVVVGDADDVGGQRLLMLDGTVFVLCGVDRGTALALRAGRERVVVAPVRRPRGAQGWSWALADPALVPTLVLPGGLPTPPGPGPVRFEPPDEADADHRFHLVGNHADRYGVFRDVVFRGVTQRMRWMPPGRFLMGSPPEEPERFSDEGPQHEVTLTEGFWLSDTACTQALWKAVTGKNPSGFKGDPQLPVEKVSWDDVAEQFLPVVNRQLAEAEVFLPTEAQWEYACRAGTTTPFSFGDQITPEWVNYDGNHPYNGGERGIYREKTVPVKALPANPWGLYQMHGNVWEWCADARRSYTGESLTDPDGGQGGSGRALRGGSWLRGAWRSRSAYRYVLHRDDRLGLIGFRFALRSIEPGR